MPGRYFLPARNRSEAIMRVVLPLLLYGLIFVSLGYVRRLGLNPPADPNDPKSVELVDGEVLARQLKWASDFINDRVARSEISDEQGRDYVAKYAAQLTEHIDVEKIQGPSASRYGEIFRAAKRWQETERLLTLATRGGKPAALLDRWVNDTLRLAEAKAQLGKIEEGIPLIRSTFDVPPEAKAPILYATRLEFVPASQGKGHDFELAKLLEEAIEQHYMTKVNTKSEAGAAFVGSRAFHIAKAWTQVRDLYRASGHEDLALGVVARSVAMHEKYRRTG